MKIRGDDSLNRLRLLASVADSPRDLRHRGPAPAEHLLELREPRPPRTLEQPVQARTRDPDVVGERPLCDLVQLQVSVDDSRHFVLDASCACQRIRMFRSAPQFPVDATEAVERAFDVDIRLVRVVHGNRSVLCKYLIQTPQIVWIITQGLESAHALVMDINHAIIATYNANLDAKTWVQTQDFVRGAIQLRFGRHHKPEQVSQALSILSGFADWVLLTGACSPEESLRADIIDSFTATRELEILPYIAARERKTLRSIAGLTNTAEFDRTSTTAPVSQPYTSDEQGAIRRWAETQPTERRRTLCGAVVALTLGAGLTRDDLMHVRERDIVTLEDGLVAIHVGDRTVPVIEEWNEYLDAFVESASDGFVVAPDVTRRSGVGMNKILGRTPTHSWFPNVQRMRNTWIIRCLDAGVPLQNVVDAAGLKTPEMLRRLIPFMARLDGDAAVRAFRLGGVVVGR